uniref:Histidine kinase n=1 Tax=Panagrellus redivivus TaxID=6233 RepID=A0A7E4V3L0_PANRE
MIRPSLEAVKDGFERGNVLSVDAGQTVIANAPNLRGLTSLRTDFATVSKRLDAVALLLRAVVANCRLPRRR